MKRTIQLFILSLGLVCSHMAWALTFPLPRLGSQVVGKIYTVHVQRGDTLKSIGLKYGISLLDMQKSNPRLKNKKLKSKTSVIVPQAFILPDVPYEGIVINLPEMRLYYFHPKRKVVMVYPIGIGRVGWKTPLGETKVKEKIIAPEWVVPKSIQDHMADNGVELPDVVPPGPNNPLGAYALRLELPGYLVHGTNRPESVGKRSSSGCIRLLPQDIAELFPQVDVNTPVRIIDQAHKVGWFKNELFIESHLPFRDQDVKVNGSGIRALVLKVSGYGAAHINWNRVFKIAGQHRGYPRFIMR